ncbi:unnamed protein product [Angiostrongylus costaricensis]|uniref:Glutamate--cysteine ligase n=1 Tax=Angiostrongylus costaricensis TaxID=334426 RepID=A0A0R3PEP8_ANGCS|nr:unnamed protein product [Angiostrongylus costaricensis]
MPPSNIFDNGQHFYVDKLALLMRRKDNEQKKMISYSVVARAISHACEVGHFHERQTIAKLTTDKDDVVVEPQRSMKLHCPTGALSAIVVVTSNFIKPEIWAWLRRRRDSNQYVDERSGAAHYWPMPSVPLTTLNLTFSAIS